MTRAARLNARLTPALSKKLARAKVLSKKTTTELVHEALSSYCDRILATASVGEVLADVGLIACIDGPRSLSSNTKRAFSKSLRKKYASR